MKNIEKQLADLQHQIEHLNNKITVLLEHTPASEGFISRTLIRKQQHKAIPGDRLLNPSKGINRFRSLQNNG
ncbi:hypothetical protein [Larkinella humicola]|uniref:Uncharacterized protein n=1 Tax=Larkinella humicola TaxID=2607654 RepID=A0A5N1JPL7_9BACT|nr:hypothetical protein [Larkinella humicola]KAA9356559.1 hypothetical protein F0P93_02070 [Larkinella humicola]